MAVLTHPRPAHKPARHRAKKYHERGAFEDGEAATSAVLPGFSVDVSELFDAAKG